MTVLLPKVPPLRGGKMGGDLLLQSRCPYGTMIALIKVLT